MQDDSDRSHQQIKRKHAQNMRLYQMHEKLVQDNEQYRRLAEKFTEGEKDIVGHLHRDE